MAAVVIALVVVLDLRSAIGISGVAVLTYYAITNAAALTLRPEQRRWPVPIAVVGLLGCVTLVAALPPVAIVTGFVTLAAGVLVRIATRRIGDDSEDASTQCCEASRGGTWSASRTLRNA